MLARTKTSYATFGWMLLSGVSLYFAIYLLAIGVSIPRPLTVHLVGTDPGDMVIVGDSSITPNADMPPSGSSPSEPQLGNPLVILVWNHETGNILSKDKLQNCTLPQNQQCIVTKDREVYNESDAIFFRPYYMVASELPDHRSLYQQWVYFTLESPVRSWINYEHETHVIRNSFNVSSTYASDSDVPYNAYYRKCSLNQTRMEKEVDSNVNYALGKSRPVAWFVSHCNADSKRDLYVQELQKYIPVDIYGRCGNLTCSKVKDNCQLKLNRHKFYLSFENAFCDEYVTEKLTRILKRNVNLIPVVMGGANYSQLLPTNTYIDVKDFTSPKKLAQFLLRIDKNDTVYNHYIRRKRALTCTNQLQGTSTSSMKYACRLCSRLHNNRRSPSSANDIITYWSAERKCRSSRQYFRHVFDRLSD